MSEVGKAKRVPETLRDSRLWLSVGAVVFGWGVVLMTASVTWLGEGDSHGATGPASLSGHSTKSLSQAAGEQIDHGETTKRPGRPPLLWWGCALSVFGGAAGALGLMQFSKRPIAESAKRDTLYGRHLVGLGYALLLVTLVNAVGLAGLVLTQRLHLAHQPDQQITGTNGIPAVTVGATTNALPIASRLPAPHDVHSPETYAIIVLLSTSMAILGALFFVANSLRRKWRDTEDPFHVSRFWSGLWYRLGEAVLFTIVCFIGLWTYQAKGSICWLPVIGLLLGMFVQSGERLIFGFAQRLFHAANEFLPLPEKKGDKEKE